jgi:hypothetical protein
MNIGEDKSVEKGGRGKVSKNRGFRVSRFQGFKVSRFQGFKVSGFQGFRVSGFQGFGFMASAAAVSTLRNKGEGWGTQVLLSAGGLKAGPRAVFLTLINAR